MYDGQNCIEAILREDNVGTQDTCIHAVLAVMLIIKILFFSLRCRTNPNGERRTGCLPESVILHTTHPPDTRTLQRYMYVEHVAESAIYLGVFLEASILLHHIDV